MATSADIAAQSSNYTGNAALGGVGGGAFTFDLTPLNQLAAYTNLYNKAQYEQRQKNTDRTLKQIADLYQKIDLSELTPKDRETVKGEFLKTMKKGQELLRNPVTSPEDQISRELEWQDNIQILNNMYSSGTKRLLSEKSQTAEIRQKYSDPKQQEFMMNKLKEQMNSTDIYTQIDPLPVFTPVAIPGVTGTMRDIFVIDRTTNMDFQNVTPIQVFDNDDAWKKAGNSLILNETPLKTLPDGKPNPEWEKLTPMQKQEAEFNSLSGTADKIGFYQQTAQTFNTAIQKYLDANGHLSDEKEKELLNKEPSLITQMYLQLKDWTTYNKTEKSLLLSGKYDSKLGTGKKERQLPDNFFDKGIIDDWSNLSIEHFLVADAWANTTRKNTKPDTDQTNIGQKYADRRLSMSMMNRGGGGGGGGTTTPTDGGKYWEGYLLPNILELKKTSGNWWGKRQNYTGDIQISPSELSGLDVVVFDEKAVNPSGSGGLSSGWKVIDNNTQVKVRYKQGQPSGLVIDGVYYDGSKINQKGVQYNNEMQRRRDQQYPINGKGDIYGL